MRRATRRRVTATAEPASVVLVDVDETVLDEMVRLAARDAAPDDVTPPGTAGDAWTEARVSWLRAFHRDRREGLDGPQGEATWAVLGADGVLGSVRLKRTDDPGVLETGIWLGRGARGRGVGTAAATAVLQRAAALGATAVRADTTSTNRQALALLERAGFQLSPVDSSGGIQAVRSAEPPQAS